MTLTYLFIQVAAQQSRTCKHGRSGRIAVECESNSGRIAAVPTAQLGLLSISKPPTALLIARFDARASPGSWRLDGLHCVQGSENRVLTRCILPAGKATGQCKHGTLAVRRHGARPTRGRRAVNVVDTPPPLLPLRRRDADGRADGLPQDLRCSARGLSYVSHRLADCGRAYIYV